MQGDFITRNDDRLDSGYGSALLVKDPRFNDRFFNLVIPLEVVPTVSGEYETFEYNSLISNVKSKVRGKLELSDASTDFAYSRENILRLDELKDRTLEFMRYNRNNTYEIFTGQISYRANDSEADVLRGTLSIVPYSLGKNDIDGRDLIRQTLEFAGTLPDSISLSSAKKEDSVEIGVKQADAEATYKVVVEGSSKITGTYADGRLTIKADDTLDKDAYATILITASSEVKMNTEGNETYIKYAPWTMSIAVDFKA